MLSEMSRPSLSIELRSGRLILGSAVVLFMAFHKNYRVLSVRIVPLCLQTAADPTVSRGNAHQIVTANAFKLKIKVSPSLCIINRERMACNGEETRPLAPAANYASNEEQRGDGLQIW